MAIRRRSHPGARAGGGTRRLRDLLDRLTLLPVTSDNAESRGRPGRVEHVLLSAAWIALPFFFIGAVNRLIISTSWTTLAIVPVIGSGLLLAIVWTTATLAQRSVKVSWTAAAVGIAIFATLALVVTNRDGLAPPSLVALGVFGLAAASEEIVFRFLLPDLVVYELAEATGKPRASAIAGVIATQVCFGLSHGWSQGWTTPKPLIAASLIGSGLALFAIARTAELHAAVAIHASLNWSFTYRFPDQARFASPSAVVGLVALSVVVASGTGLIAFRGQTRTPGGSP